MKVNILRWGYGLICALVLAAGLGLLVNLVLTMCFPCPRTSDTFLVFSPDERFLVGGTHHGAVQIWDLSEASPAGRRLSIRDFGTIWPETVRFVDDETLVAVRQNAATPANAEVVYWNVATDREKETFPLAYRPTELRRNREFAMSPTGEHLAVCAIREDHDVVDAWDLAAKRQTTSIALPGQATQILISSDGGTIACSSQDSDVPQRAVLLDVWDVKENQIVCSLEHNWTQIALMSPSGDAVATGPGGLVLFDVHSDATRTFGDEADGEQFPYQFSRDGNRILAAEVAPDPIMFTECWSIWDVVSGKQVATMHTSQSGAAHLSPSGRFIAFYHNPRVSLWRESTGEMTPLPDVSGRHVIGKWMSLAGLVLWFSVAAFLVTIRLLFSKRCSGLTAGRQPTRTPSEGIVIAESVDEAESERR